MLAFKSIGYHVRELAALNFLAELRGRGWLVLSDPRNSELICLHFDEKLTPSEAALVEDLRVELVGLARLDDDAGEHFTPLPELAGYFYRLTPLFRIGFAWTCRRHLHDWPGDSMDDAQRAVSRVWQEATA